MARPFGPGPKEVLARLDVIEGLFEHMETLDMRCVKLAERGHDAPETTALYYIARDACKQAVKRLFTATGRNEDGSL